MLWRVIEQEVVPTSEREGLAQTVWSPLAQGVLTGKYRPGEQPPESSRGADAEVGGSMRGFLRDDVLTRVQGPQAHAWLAWPPCRGPARACERWGAGRSFLQLGARAIGP
jgi:aryl-alcohol dehydrogenase-like predicted oxidoreductase